MVKDPTLRPFLYNEWPMGTKARVEFRRIVQDDKTSQLYQRVMPRVGNVLRAEFVDHRLILTVSFPTTIHGQVIKKRVYAGHAKLMANDTPVDQIGHCGYDDWLGREVVI